jgi:hypothetical protein
LEDEKKYLIDIAKDKTYQNQFDDYHKEFSKWRTKKDNPYGYSFVHDTREHTYVDGEGYYQRSADAAERKALVKCLGLLGIILIFMLTIDGIISLILYRIFQDPGAYAIYYSKIDAPTYEFTPILVLLYCSMNLFKYLAAFGIFVRFTGIPLKVAAPVPKGARLSKSGIFLILVILVFSRVFNYIISLVFGLINLDCVYAIAIHDPNNNLSDLIYLIFNCVLVSAVSELLFRGAIMQTFRQFGDTFAMLVSGIAFSLSYYDISSMGYAVLCSATLGLFTIRTGSLKSAIIMRITASVSGYALTRLVIDSFTNGRIVEVIICTFIMSVAAFIFARLMCNGKWAFSVKDDPSELSTGEKLKLFFTTNSIVIWLVGVAGMFFLIMRFK